MRYRGVIGLVPATLLAALVSANPAFGLQPVVAQFQVNTYTTSNQRNPGVGVGASGGFVVVWESRGGFGDDTDAYSVQGQRFDSAGAAVGSQFQVNTYTTGSPAFPAVIEVAVDVDGDFLVVWAGQGSGNDPFLGINGRRYDSSGSPIGSEFQVNTYTDNDQRRPAVDTSANGTFVVVWDSVGSSGTDTSNHSIQGQRYDAAGSALGAEFQVNTYTTLRQRFPEVAVASDGDFVVVWEGEGSGGNDSSEFSIQGQRYDSDGSAAGAEFQVNTYTTSSQRFPSLGMDDDGNFVVAWASNGSVGNDDLSYSVQAQRYDSSGNALGSQFQVNTYTTGAQGDPVVGVDSDGDFIVIWSKSGDEPQAQRYDAAGNAIGTEATFLPGGPGLPPPIDFFSNANAVTVWASAEIQGQLLALSTNVPALGPLGLTSLAVLLVAGGAVAFAARRRR